MIWEPLQQMNISWPNGKRFAFSIVDDTDDATVENVRPIYDLLAECGLRTTKTVWPLRPIRSSSLAETLEDSTYRNWIEKLQDDGFEIGFHGAADETSMREVVIRALNLYRDVLGHDPRIHANHFRQRESIYWGRQRLHGVRALTYSIAERLARRGPKETSLGTDERSPLFWGDICRERITYVRNFAFLDVNTLRQDPVMPYHDPTRPYVKFWFSASEGSDVHRFCDLVSETNQDRLSAESGACVVYTHFAKGFVGKGGVNRRTAELVRRLSRLPGWFVPVSDVLDFLRTRREWRKDIDRKMLSRMEWHWLADKARVGTQ